MTEGRGEVPTCQGKLETVLTPGHKAATQNNDVLVDLWGSLDGQADKNNPIEKRISSPYMGSITGGGLVEIC